MIIVLLFNNSCIRPSLIKPFKNYSLPLQTVNLKTKGIYICEDNGESFFLYEDGKMQILGSYFIESWENSNKKIHDYLKGSIYYNSKDGWGHYYINGDSIFLQYFNRNGDEFYKRWIFEMNGNIITNSMIQISSDYSTLGNDAFNSNIGIYKFYDYENKSDSTKAWFIKKKWYRNNLHPDRKSKLFN